MATNVVIMPPLPKPDSFAKQGSSTTDAKITYRWFDGVNRIVNNVSTTATGANANAVAAYSQANSAYQQANTASVQANGAFHQANLAFGEANLAYLTATVAYGTANAALTIAYESYDQANTATSIAEDAYLQANSAFDNGNLSYGVAVSAFSQANSAFGAANSAAALAEEAYNQANLAYSTANALTGTTVVTNSFTATANQSVFTLSANVPASDLAIVTVNGLVQVPDNQYTITSNNILTLGTPRLANDLVEARLLLNLLGSANGYEGSNTTAAYYAVTSSQTITTANGVPVVIDSFPSNMFSTIKYVCQVSATSSLNADEILILQDGTNAQFSDYNSLQTNESLGDYNFNIANSMCWLTFTPDNPDAEILTIRITRNGIYS